MTKDRPNRLLFVTCVITIFLVIVAAAVSREMKDDDNANARDATVTTVSQLATVSANATPKAGSPAAGSPVASPKASPIASPGS